jgi:hypothetical protein
MKAGLMVVVLALNCFGQEALHEYRVVNGKSVDLTPSIRWQHKYGAYDERERPKTRPMPHWKWVFIKEVKEQVANWDRCLVRNEAGEDLELYISNLVPQVRKPMVRARDIKTRLAQIAGDKKAAQGLAYGAGGKVANVGRATYEDLVAEEGRLTQELQDLRGDLSAANITAVFAMFMGQKYSGVEVWECGKQQFAPGQADPQQAQVNDPPLARSPSPRPRAWTNYPSGRPASH